VARLLERDPKLWLSRSWTTRARRPGESDDAYVFVDRATFQQRIDDGGFLEWAEVVDQLYGTPAPDPPPGRDPVYEIDVAGARQVLALHPDALLLFVDTPTVDEQRRRLETRGDHPTRIEQRMALGAGEREAGRALGMTWVINDDVDRAADELASLIQQARAERA
jgi:guanylate kinase